MKFSELIRMAAHNLISRRGRTALNLFGITLGCTVLMVTAAAGQGVRDAIRVLFDSSPDAKRIFCNKYLYNHFNAKDAPHEATKVEGKMSDKRRERISKKLAQQWVQDQYRQRDIPTRLSFDQLSKIRSWPGVARASADVSVYGEGRGADEPIEVTVGIPGELGGAQQPILAGERLLGDPNEVVI
ncbi:MAG: ABC transporter permease, partial [Planctomycetaceae bacterium]